MWPFKKKEISFLSLANSIWGEVGGGRLSAETSLRVSDIYACVRVLSNTLSSLPLSLHFADINKGKAIDHPYYNLLHRKPNLWMTPSDFKRVMLMHLALKGNFYCHKNIVGGIVRELNPINPDSVEVKQDPDLVVRYGVTFKDGSKSWFTTKEILHIKSLSLDGVVGLNVVELMSSIFMYSRDAQDFQDRILRNGAKPSGMLVFPSDLKDDQYKKEVERINAAASGDKVGSTMVLDRGVEFKKISLSASDIMLLDSMKLTTSKICGVLGVPPHMIGELTRSTNNNIEQQSLEYYVHGILPYCVMIEDGLNTMLDALNDGARYKFKFNAAAILRGDYKTRMEGHQLAIINGMMSPDEVRELEDIAPRKDGLGGVYYYPANLLPAGTKPKQEESKV
jgi:HK97 family phage portal protein